MKSVSCILSLIIGSAATIFASTSPAHALTWDFTSSTSLATGTGTITYSGTGDGTFTLTSLNYNETSPNSGGTYILDTVPTIGNIGTNIPSIDEVVVSGGLITQYNLYAVDSAASGNNYGRFFVSDLYGQFGLYVGEYPELGSSSSIAGSITFSQATSSAVPFDIPYGSSIPVAGSLLGLAVLRKARKSTSNIFSITTTEKVN